MILRLPGMHSPRRARSRLLTVLAAVSVAGCEGITSVAPTPVPLPGDPLWSETVTPVVDVYVSAHQDDWQLFAGERTAASARGTTQKIVVVYTTAGDANRAAAYWQAREGAAKASIDTLIGPGPWTCATVTISTHPIQRCVKGKVASYFMRLPDGNLDGSGYGSGSLRLLQAGTRTVTAKDGSTTYTSWADFTSTLRAIITSEVGVNTSPYVQVYAPEHDRTINTGDHDDHFRTGDAAQVAMQGLPYDLGWYVGYHTQNLPANLSAAELAWKKAEFWRYSEAMGAAGYGVPWTEPIYHTWMARTYVRAVDYVPPGPPTAPGNLAGSATYAVATLTWADNSSDETRFRVQRAPDVEGAAGAFADLGTAAANSGTYTDATIAPATSYWYRVRSESNAGVSAYTDAVPVTTQPLPAPPSAPTSFQATALSGSRIDLSWTDVATNEEAYQLERAPDAEGTAGTYALLATLAPNTVSYSDNGLQPNTPYWYRLRAVNAGGASAHVTISRSTTSAFEVDVYVQAYQDDWQLFMGDRAHASFQTAQRVVFVYTTAGDQGRDSTYWLTREAASRASIDTLVGPGPWTCAPRTVGTRTIRRCEKGKAVAYYMRLPDGFWGDGFRTNGSLNKLKAGQATTTRDGSTTYASWMDFTTTLGTLIRTETGGQSGPYVEVHSPDHSTTANPGDMPDRYRTGEALLAASQGQRWDLAWYVGKGSQNLPQNVTGLPYQKKVEEYQAYDRVMRRGGYGSTWYEVQGWLPRTYFRTEVGQ